MTTLRSWRAGHRNQSRLHAALQTVIPNAPALPLQIDLAAVTLLGITELHRLLDTVTVAQLRGLSVRFIGESPAVLYLLAFATHSAGTPPRPRNGS